MKDIYRGNFLRKGEKTYHFGGIAFIFDCPWCEYARAGHDPLAITSIRNAHLVSAHPEHHLDTVEFDSRERVDTEFQALSKRLEKIFVK